jgi:hypothetical protein
MGCTVNAAASETKSASGDPASASIRRAVIFDESTNTTSKKNLNYIHFLVISATYKSYNYSKGDIFLF